MLLTGAAKANKCTNKYIFFDFRRIKKGKVYLSIFQLTDKAGFQVLTVNQASSGSGIDLEVE